MTATLQNIHQGFVELFNEADRQRNEPPFLRRLRKAALARFDELGLPTHRNEDWKYTSVAGIAQIPYRFPVPGTPSTESLRPYVLTPTEAYQLTFIDGEFNWELSVLPSAAAPFKLMALSEAVRAEPTLVEKHLGAYADSREQPFTALNTALQQDGALLVVPPNVVVDRPIHLTFMTSAHSDPVTTQPRNVLVVVAHAQATIVESYVGANEEKYLTNAVTEASIADRAQVEHFRIQREGPMAAHVGNLYVVLHRASKFSSQLVSLGGLLVRNEAHARFAAEGAECTLNGLYFATEKQHVDNHTVIDRAMPHCASHELYKGVLDGNGQGVFNGKIFVRQDAQKTDAKQTNQTLLLSDNATINTKPQLEIYADDVKCTHGATVGQLDDNALFYLRSRGMGIEEARSLLIYAFANDIVNRITVPTVREQLEEVLLASRHLPAAFDPEDAE